MEDHQSLSHTKWQCKYHIVFILNSGDSNCPGW